MADDDVQILAFAEISLDRGLAAYRRHHKKGQAKTTAEIRDDMLERIRGHLAKLDMDEMGFLAEEFLIAVLATLAATAIQRLVCEEAGR